MTLTAFEVTAPEVSFDRVRNRTARATSWRAALWSVVSVRWAAVALALFLAGLVAQLNGAPMALWWTLYLGCYLAGGWGSAWAGAQALRNKALDV
ncbi:MAG: heavy metal translocating P-type ATPase, partial [Mycobacterium gordonae]|nr:heavy metal translocating P-type ATPase [Mycobacterium gordonae]